ncbi:hypothetical protein SLEP1_g56801 [Rubroshorea leprosula]|uniref:Uncharacterized protein n=1 Tax=Rubroshorea leprosula TaxID=152421 RepID=A0AAV5MKK4_9ROSI|nr:hypothetical protein SLEP1_g56801 [Rubroshorea leprosula]
MKIAEGKALSIVENEVQNPNMRVWTNLVENPYVYLGSCGELANSPMVAQTEKERRENIPLPMEEPKLT